MIDGPAAEDTLGYAISGGGDLNGDGFADLVIAAPFSNAAGFAAGQVFVVYGQDFTGRLTQAGTPDGDTLLLDTRGWLNNGTDVIVVGRGNDVIHSQFTSFLFPRRRPVRRRGGRRPALSAAASRGSTAAAATTRCAPRPPTGDWT